MKNLLLFIIVSLQSIFGFSQEMYKIEYKFTFKNGFTCDSNLFTNNKESIFKIDDNRASGMADLPHGDAEIIENDELSRFFYTNNDLSYARTIVYEEEILYSDKYDSKINWKITPEETKKIDKYNCTKAEMKINGRNYEVWFTFDVPVKYGPLKLNKLPGLIVEVNCDNNYLKISLQSVSKTKDLKTFNFCKNYFLKSKKVISFEAYGKKIIDFEVSTRVRLQSMNKKMNLKNKTDFKLSFEDKITADSYIEFPDNFMSEMRKTNGK